MGRAPEVERAKLTPLPSHRQGPIAQSGAPSLGNRLARTAAQGRESFGYRPLLAESFTAPEAFAGTCYKASNWQDVGFSAGYRRHRADFYVPNERPK